jgi:hypothetical protein
LPSCEMKWSESVLKIILWLKVKENFYLLLKEMVTIYYSNGISLMQRGLSPEGKWLVFLTKNGLLSRVEIKKNSGEMKEDEYFALFDAQFCTKSDISKPLQALNLDEKNCNLSYDSSKKAFVLSYVSLNSSKIEPIGTDVDRSRATVKKLLCLVCFGFLLLVVTKGLSKLFSQSA